MSSLQNKKFFAILIDGFVNYIDPEKFISYYECLTKHNTTPITGFDKRENMKRLFYNILSNELNIVVMNSDKSDIPMNVMEDISHEFVKAYQLAYGSFTLLVETKTESFDILFQSLFKDGITLTKISGMMLVIWEIMKALIEENRISEIPILFKDVNHYYFQLLDKWIIENGGFVEIISKRLPTKSISFGYTDFSKAAIATAFAVGALFSVNRLLGQI